MDSKRLSAEALRGIKAAAEGNTTDTPMAFCSMLRSLLADRAALEQRVGELRDLISEAHEAIAADWAAGGPRKGRCYCIECDGDNDTASPSEPRFIRHKTECLVSRLAAAKALA